MLLLASSPAWAQPAMTPPAAPEPTPASPTGPKSDMLAGTLSWGLTSAGVVTLLITTSLAEPDDLGRRLKPKFKTPLYLTSGLLIAVGPTSGHLYAGEYWNRGLAVRLVSGTVMVLAAGAIDDVSSETDHNGNQGAAAVTVVAGLVLLGASVYECATAPRAARRYNARHASLAIAPVVSHEQQGVAVVGTF